MASKDYDENAKKANYCDVAERYNDMAVEMKKVIQMYHDKNQEISVSNRNRFSLAYKNLVSSRRSSWRVLFSERQKLEEKQPEDLHIIDDILMRVETELLAICDEVLEIIDKYALQDFENRSLAHKVFFLKMKGDYHRYRAEVLTGKEEETAAELADASYKEAKECAEGLNPTDPIRLGLYLNFSVFNYEILNKADVACNIARNAFSDAITELDSLSEDYYKDSTLIMQLLRDNLTLWTSKNDAAQSKVDENDNEIS